ncbi:MAG: hypothetical protein ACPLZG_11490 [Thermoproteota archaeon]
MAENKTETVYSFLPILKKLFSLDKTFRDPVWGDIFLNHLEVRVIDTEVFQRLGRIRQLGPTYLVYRGAQHTRFDHSLGVLHWTQKLLDKIDKNPHKKGELWEVYLPRKERENFTKANAKRHLSEEEKKTDDTYRTFFFLVARLAALIHDLPTIPFSHTLDDEGNLFGPQWENQERIKHIFRKEEELYECVLNYLKEENNKLQENERINNDNVIENLCKSIIRNALEINILQNSKENEVRKWINEEYEIPPEFPLKLEEDALELLSYIIGNAICADIIDYTSRDFHFCGINEKIDTRFTNYIIIEDYIEDHKNKKVIAYRICKPTTKEYKLSVLTGLMNLMHKRYMLRQFVHFHHTKVALSAMISEAVNFYLNDGQVQGAEPFDVEMIKKQEGDDDLIEYLLKSNNESTKYLVEMYRKRRPYKKVACRSYERTWKEMVGRLGGEAKIEQLRDPKYRIEIEKKLSRWASFILLKQASENDKKLLESLYFYSRPTVILYVPSPPERLYKEVTTYVQYFVGGESKVNRLDRISREEWEKIPTLTPITATFSEYLKEQYTSLWELVILVTPDYYSTETFNKNKESFERDVVRVFKSLITPPRDVNEVEPLEALNDEERDKFKKKIEGIPNVATRSNEDPSSFKKFVKEFPDPEEVRV